MSFQMPAAAGEVKVLVIPSAERVRSSSDSIENRWFERRTNIFAFLSIPEFSGFAAENICL